MCIWYSHYTKWDRYTQRTHIHIFISQTTNDTYLAWIRNSEHYVGIVFIVVWTRKNIHSVHLFFPQRIHTYLPLPCPGYLCLFLILILEMLQLVGYFTDPGNATTHCYFFVALMINTHSIHHFLPTKDTCSTPPLP